MTCPHLSLHAHSFLSISFYFPLFFLIIDFPVFKEVLKIILHKQSRLEGHFKTISWGLSMHPLLTVRWWQGLFLFLFGVVQSTSPMNSLRPSLGSSPWEPPAYNMRESMDTGYTSSKHVCRQQAPSFHPLSSLSSDLPELAMNRNFWARPPFLLVSHCIIRPKAGLVNDTAPLHKTLLFQIPSPSIISVTLWHL